MSQRLAFSAHSPASAPERSRALMAAVQQKNGFLPDAVARLAESPHVLATLLQHFKAFEATSLSALEREVVTMTVARVHDCHLCIAMHSSLLSAQAADPALLEALRAGAALEDPRLEALADFTREVLARAGAVGEEARARFLAVGFTPAQALEVVLGVAVYTLSTFANRLTEARVDAPLRAFAPSGKGLG